MHIIQVGHKFLNIENMTTAVYTPTEQYTGRDLDKKDTEPKLTVTFTGGPVTTYYGKDADDFHLAIQNRINSDA